MQRPFVWKATQVRDLVDSLYNGFPTGYLITWSNPQVRLKNGELSGNKMTLIDGQQRVTAIMAAIAGRKVVDEKYRLRNIAIAYNPFPEEGTEHFEVQDSSHLRSKRWIPDISRVFEPSFSTFSFIKQYCKDNPDVDADALNTELERLRSLVHVQIGIIVLNQELDIDTVTEIFIRINSKGTVLDQTDFVMSRLSANDRYGGSGIRQTIDFFCHLLREPGFLKDLEQIDPEFYEDKGKRMRWVTEQNSPVFEPAYADIIRAAFMYKYDRAKMADLVNLLSGRNFETKVYEETIIEDTFSKMSEAVDECVNEFNFKSFLECIESTGFVIQKQISSAMTIDFAYALFLRLRDSGMDCDRVKAYVGRWFVMSNITRRYSSSPESKMDRDLRMIRDKGFVQYLTEIEDSELSDSFWETKLIMDLETSRYSNPLFYTYLASQVFFNDCALLSLNTKVYSLARIDIGDVHHIFPKAYLAANGFQPAMYNQIANFAYISRPTNIAISDRAPNVYLGIVKGQCMTGRPVIGDITDMDALVDNLRVNCVPENVFDMDCSDYEEFLRIRRRLMADRIREYYRRIKLRCRGSHDRRRIQKRGNPFQSSSSMAGESPSPHT